MADKPVKIETEDLIASVPQPELPPPASVPVTNSASVPIQVQTQAPALAQAAVLSPAHAKRKAQELPEHLMHKNRLQEHAQRSSIPLPVYQTVNEGLPHAPKFRSTVLVDGVIYTSPNTFSHRKAAEQDVAKLALEGISKRIKEEGCPLVRQDTVFCKSILNEFAIKMNLEKPTYRTVQSGGLLPVFVSSLVFDGVSYNGETGRTKKEAEQLAARAVILSLLGNSGCGTILSEIIKSKVKLYAALDKIKDSCDAHYGTATGVENTGTNAGILPRKNKEVEIATENVPTTAGSPASLETQPHHHVFTTPKSTSQPITFPIAFVPPVLEQPPRKRRKNKRKGNKKLCTDAQPPIAAVPVSEAPPCSVAQ